MKLDGAYLVRWEVLTLFLSISPPRQGKIGLERSDRTYVGRHFAFHTAAAFRLAQTYANIIAEKKKKSTSKYSVPTI